MPTRREFLKVLLVASLAPTVLLAPACANQKTAVRAAAAEAIDALMAGEAFPSNDSYSLLPDPRLSGLEITHEPIRRVCETMLEGVTYELGDVAIDTSQATVQVTLSGPDLFAALERAQADVAAYASSAEGNRELAVREDINQRARYLCDWLLTYLVEHLVDEDIETIELASEARLTRGVDGSWQLDWAENPDLLAALFRVR